MLEMQPRTLARALAGARPFVQIVARHHHLADDLAGGQVAHQLLRAGMAERTGQRAADLGGNAQRAAILLGDIDDLHLVAARDPHQVLARAVEAHLLGHDLRHGQVETPPQARRGSPWRGSSSPKSRTPFW
jgi:hypothetical protein